jgi:hypothetical protein
MNYRLRLVEERMIEKVTCGLHLRTIVGLEMYTIKHIIVDIEFVGKECIPLIARLASPALSSLALTDLEVDSSECYEALAVFLEQCDGILALRLQSFDVGDGSFDIPQVVRNRSGQLSQLELLSCRGNIRMFVENNPILSLRNLAYQSNLYTDNEIVTLLASNCRELTRAKLVARFDSSAPLLKIIECCQGGEI